MLVKLLLVTAASFVAAAINAIAGGGTFITFPALTGFMGFSDKVANMTSTVGLWPGSVASVVAARTEFRRLPRGIVVLYSVISLIGGAIGAILFWVTRGEAFKLVIPALLAFPTLVFAFSKPIARWAGRKHGDRSLKWTLFVAVLQLAVAIYGGYFGAGIGVLMLAGLSFAGLDDLHQMNALKVLLATLINGISAIIFLFAKVDWRIAGIMAGCAGSGGVSWDVVVPRGEPSAILG